MQALSKNKNRNSSLFQKGIQRFIKKYPSSRMNTLQTQILDGAKSSSINRRENAQTLRGCLTGCNNSSSSSSSAASTHCCCCPESVSYNNLKKIDTANHMGHSFDAEFKLSYSKQSGLKSNKSCTMEWWEKTNVPAHAVHPPNKWFNVTNVKQSQVYQYWNARKQPCPGKETVTIPDPPALGKRPGRTVMRKLEFNLGLKSGPGCSCKNKSIYKKAEQVLTMVNAKADWKKSHFKIL